MRSRLIASATSNRSNVTVMSYFLIVNILTMIDSSDELFAKRFDFNIQDLSKKVDTMFFFENNLIPETKLEYIIAFIQRRSDRKRGR